MTLQDRLMEIYHADQDIQKVEQDIQLNEDHPDVWAARKRLQEAHEKYAALVAGDKTKHNQDCLDDQKAYAEYCTKWPNHCTACGGTGEIHWQENQAPLGSGQRWMEDMSDLCACTADDKCPRCMGKTVIANPEAGDDAVRCTDCGWQTGTDGEPSLECWCGMDDSE